MSIQRLCYLGGGGGSITEALPEVGVHGEKSIHLRVTEEQRAQLILRGRGTLGNRENMEQGNRYHLPSLGGPHQLFVKYQLVHNWV